MLERALRLALAILLLALPAGPCLAHAGLVSAVPAPGAKLERAPAIVELVFNEPVRAILLQLRDADGRVVAEGAEAGDDPVTLRLRVPADLPSAVYLVGWRVTSIDGHVVGGTHAFAVGDAAAPDLAADADGPTFSWTRTLARLLYLFGTLAGGGAVLAALLLHREQTVLPVTRRFTFPALGLGVAAAIVQLRLLGVELSPTEPASLLDPSPFALALPTDAGRALLLGGTAMLLLMALIGRPLAAPARWLAALALAALFASFGLSGHAATAWPRLAMAPLLVLHVAIGAFWLGALWPLLRLLRTSDRAAADTADRFGRIAVVAVPALLVAAGVLLVRQLVGGSVLLESPWVVAMAIKLLAVAGLLAIAARNRLVLVPALRLGVEGAASRLGRLLRVDLALAMLVLAGTAVMATHQPPRLVRAAAVATPLELRGARAHVRLTMRFASERAGANRLEAAVVDADGRSIDAPEIWLLLLPQVEGIDPLRVDLVRRSAGVFAAEDLLLVPAGPWSYEAVVLVDDFTSVALEGEFRLR